MSKKRLRIFAGPNGSGKSTIFSAVDKKVGCKYFVNADEIYKSLSETGCLSFDYYTILPQEDSLKEAFRTSGFYDKSRSGKDIISRLTVENNVLHVPRESVDSYFAAFIADFLRFNMLNIVRQFTIETVMCVKWIIFVLPNSPVIIFTCISYRHRMSKSISVV